MEELVRSPHLPQRRAAGRDPMLNEWRTVATEPRRVVIEFTPSEWSALAAACGPFVSPAVYVRLVALRLASVEQAR